VAKARHDANSTFTQACPKVRANYNIGVTKYFRCAWPFSHPIKIVSLV
jgi:hypothetical protein